MSMFSKGAKKLERGVSKTATKLGVGKDLKKAANVFGAANVGGIIGAGSGFLTGGPMGAIYGGIAGGGVAGYRKLKGKSQNYGTAILAGGAAGYVGPMLYTPGSTGTATVMMNGVPTQVGVKTASTGLFSSTGSFGSLAVKASNPITSSLGYISKNGGIINAAVNGLQNIFSNPQDPGINPDLTEGNAIPQGGNFSDWLKNMLPGKQSDPTSVNVTTEGAGGQDSSSLMKPILIAGAVVGGLFLLFSKHSPMKRFA